MRIFSKKFWAQAKNDAGERIESLRFSVPALRVGVLEYGAGQLTTNNAALDGKPVRLYYPPESVSDKTFLKSLETAPVIVGVGHNTTTSEKNKAIDGWAAKVNYDDTKQAAIIDGVVKGKNEVSYIRNNLNTKDFGASAFIDILGLTVQSGTTPDGQAYDAIANNLRATHVALTENVRDPENKIKVINAVVINSLGLCDESKKSEVKNVEISKEEIAAIVKNAVAEAVTAKNDADRIARLEAIVRNMEEEKEKEEAKNKEEDEEEKKEAKNKAKNKEESEEKEDKGDDKKETEGEVVENAKPSQALVAAFASALNMDFGAKTPSFKTLAALSGIAEADPIKRIAAVNAKFSELSAKTSGAAQNTSSVEVF